ncbi:MAG: hypothetical protein ACK4SY_04945 [Pyrobaculum sp.]
MRLVLLLVIAAVMSAFLPIEAFISDAFRPPADKVLTSQGVVRGTPLWLYTWRVTVAFITLLFAAIVATFFVRINERARWTFAMLSIATAVFHYLTLLFTSSPPGYGVSIYPLFYTIKVGEVTQTYLDIGQILIIYSIYNIYKIRSLKEFLF